MKIVIRNKNWSSWSMRPWLALKLTGLSFEEIIIPLRQGEITQEAIRQLSPAGKVPILIDNALTIHDSLAICEYLAERAPLWPKEADKRALARAITCEMHSGFASLRSTCPMDIAKRTTTEITPDVAKDLARIEAIWAHATGPFLFGTPCIADCFYAPVVSRFVTYSLPTSDTSKRYIDTIWNWDLFQEWVKGS